jgi:hypothetical protein
MKQSISTPVAVGILIVIVLVVGFFCWQRYMAPPAVETGAPTNGGAAGARGAHTRAMQGAPGGSPTR